MSSNSLDIYSRELASIPLLSEKDERETYENIDDEAKEKLIKGNLRLVIKIASGLRNINLDLEDLISEGNSGLVVAANKFDPNKGVKFATYAAIWIRQRIYKALSEKSRTIRIPNDAVGKYLKIREFCNQYREQNDEEEPSLELLSGKFNISKIRIKNIFAVCELPISLNSKTEQADSTEEKELGDTVEDTGSKSAYEMVQDKEDKEEAESALSQLTDKERFILSKRFGLSGNKPETLEEVGKRFKLSREWVRKIEVRALVKMRLVFFRK